MSFLPVEHTHESIDQAFRRSSERLRSEEAVSSADLHSVHKRAYNGFVRVVHLKSIVDWSGLCSQERALQRVPPFSPIRFFSLQRSFSTTSPGSRTSCFVEARYCDEWPSLRSGSRAIKNGLIRFT